MFAEACRVHSAAVAVLVTIASAANAGIVTVGPFVGSETENWESYQNYRDGEFYYLSNPTTIMGGGASISNPKMAVYQADTWAFFGLGDHGEAKVSDGAKGMGIDDGPQTTTITFTNAVTAFGAYWGLGEYPTYSNKGTLVFYDAANQVIDVPQTFIYNPSNPDGTLEWHGYRSNVPIAKLTYTGDFIAIDGLQAEFVVPEPSTMMLALLATGGAGCVLIFRRRYRHC